MPPVTGLLQERRPSSDLAPLGHLPPSGEGFYSFSFTSAICRITLALVGPP